MNARAWTVMLLLTANMLFASRASAGCRMVADAPTIAISQDVETTLRAMDVDRPLAFRILWRTAMPETQGCWSGATGNFDGQLVSVGAMQWNFGQGSLQFVLHKYRQGFLTQDAFDQELDRLMPRYGKLFFSEGCRHAQLSRDCRNGLLAAQSGGRLNDDFAAELNALFESDPMIQVQVDRFLATLTSVASDLKRLFGGQRPTELRVKWALDTKTQQGSFPKDVYIKAMRQRTASWTAQQRRDNLLGMVNWYSGLCQFPTSEGIRLDCAFNIPNWNKRVAGLYSPSLATNEREIFDLLNLTWMRSLQAQGKGGAYQALALERRVTIILGVGSVAGRVFS